MIDKTTYKLLKALYRHGELRDEEVDAITEHPADGRPSPYISALRENRLIIERIVGAHADGAGGFFDGISVYRINLKGRAFVEQRRRDLRNFWLPYSITTVLAVASLMVAICGLLLSRG